MHGTASEVMSCRGRVAERVECDVRRGRCVAAGKAAAGACFAVVQTRGCVGGARATPAQCGGGGDDDDRHSEMRRRRGVLSLTLARATPEAGPTCQHHTPAPACVPELQEQTARRFSIPLTTPPHRRPDKLCGSVAHYTPCRSLRFIFSSVLPRVSVCACRSLSYVSFSPRSTVLLPSRPHSADAVAATTSAIVKQGRKEQLLCVQVGF